MLGIAGLLVSQPANAVPARNDLVIDFGANGLWLRLNNSTWKKIDSQSPLAVAACDLDTDGIDDVIASFAGRGLVARLSTLQDEEPGFTHPMLDEVAAQLVTGDFDGNGFCDIAALVKAIPPAFVDTVWINLNGNGNVWFHGLEDGTTEDGGVVTGTMASANLDGTPNDDLVLLSGYFGFEAAFNDRFDFKFLDGSGPKKIAAGDVNGSGYDELIYSQGLQGGGDGLFVSYDRGVTPSNVDTRVKRRNGAVNAIAVGDLDPNSRDDILLGDSNGVWVAYNNAFPFTKIDSHPTSHLAIGDFDNDGKNDIAADFGSAGVWTRLSKSGVFKLLRAWPSQAIVPGAFD
jgi:hypothetical protein